ncbi:MAG: RNA polymerase sigma factor [Xanthomonadaceae bacterium]|nr:RNA polymerase sigma factor [Xanthomonadaceae bacterium]
MTKRVPKPSRQQTVAGSAYEQYHAELHRFLIRRLQSAHHAQDLAQEAYLRLLRVERAELVRQPRAYLYRIAVNLISEFRLRASREPIVFDSDALAAAAEHLADAPADEGERAADAQQIELILEQLPPLYRAIFVLRKRDGLSYQEIAERLEISVHTVKKYLARAVAKCRSAHWPQQV